MWAPLIPPLPFTEGRDHLEPMPCITHSLRRVGQMNSRHAMVRINDGVIGFLCEPTLGDSHRKTGETLS